MCARKHFIALASRGNIPNGWFSLYYCNITNHELVAQCCVLPCLTYPFFSPVNYILTVVKATWKLESCGPVWQRYCQVIWVSWILEIAQLLCCDLCRVPPLDVDKVLAAADELWAFCRGYFVFARRITKQQQLGNLLLTPEFPGLRMKVMQRQNRWWWDGEVFWHGASQFLMHSFVAVERRRQLSSWLCCEWP